IDTINQILQNLSNIFSNNEGRLPTITPHRENFMKAIENLKQTTFTNLKEVDISIQSLNNVINTIPKDAPLQNDFNLQINELNNARKSLGNSIAEDPKNKLYELIPKPLYKDKVFKLEDKISVDEFIANPSKSTTFHCLAVIGGLNPSGVQNIRKRDLAAQNSYFEVVSKNLSDQLNSFWTQENYTFKIGIKGTDLSFTVLDKTTGKETSVLERSEGFKWWTAFFLDLSLSLALGSSGTNILLLDNPATELHDEGKGDVQKFLTKVANTGKLQIIYATHERALIDPWRIERIRLVEKRPEGTQIEKVRTETKGDLLNRIRRSIGSPAKYSLFGAPRTIAFEGISDILFFSAFNEYLEQIDKPFLNKDWYSINAFNGVSKAPEFCSQYKNLGLDFVVVIDSGSATKNMKDELQNGDFEKFFIEIKDIVNKQEADIEDLIEPTLYHEAFVKAYEKFLESLPRFSEIEKMGKSKKCITKYNEWFDSIGKKGAFNKTLVANQMFQILMKTYDGQIDKDAVTKTCDNFTKLINKIQEKFEKNVS